MMDEQGVMIDEFTFTNNLEGIQDLTTKLNVEDTAVMESTGEKWVSLICYSHSYILSYDIEAITYNNMLEANARRIKRGNVT